MKMTPNQLEDLVGPGYDECLTYINDNLADKKKKDFPLGTFKEYVNELIDDLYTPEGSPC